MVMSTVLAFTPAVKFGLVYRLLHLHIPPPIYPITTTYFLRM